MNDIKQRTKETLEQLGEKRATAMGEVTLDSQRQMVGLLYDQIMDDFQFLTTVTASAQSIAVPKYQDGSENVWVERAKSPWMTIVLSALTCVCTLSGYAHWLCALSAILTLSQTIVSLFFQKRAKETTVLETDVTLSLEDAPFERILTHRLADLDKACKDVVRLSQTSQDSNENSELVAKLYCELYTMEAMQDIDQAQYCCHLALQLLEQNGLKAVAYTEESADLFTTTPSDMVEMTLCPAICKQADDQLLTKGSHYLKQQKKGA